MIVLIAVFGQFQHFYIVHGHCVAPIREMMKHRQFLEVKIVCLPVENLLLWTIIQLLSLKISPSQMSLCQKWSMT